MRGLEAYLDSPALPNPGTRVVQAPHPARRADFYSVMPSDRSSRSPAAVRRTVARPRRRDDLRVCAAVEEDTPRGPSERLWF